ncbi:MAG: CHAD domain-containing protein, partial [Pseudomonadota bacterium]
MIEVELKILLPDAAAAKALSVRAAKAGLSDGPAARRTLRSIYFDTPERALAAQGIALRLRKVGRGWVQTVKRGAGAQAGGLFRLEEDERPAPGGRLDLAAVEPAALREAVEEALGDAALTAQFETDIKRAKLELALPSGRVELAVDAGRVVAGDRESPLFEAEFELLSGAPAAVYEAARTLLSTGAWRFSGRSKAARGHDLALGRPALPDAAPRQAGKLGFAPEASTEAAAAAALRSCLAQIDANMAACLAGEAPEGPHQLRVGLRRLRSALGLYREALAGPEAEALGEAAKDLAATAGALRDLDVQIEETLRPLASDPANPDAAGFAALAAALEARREAARAALRRALLGPEARGLLLDLSAFAALRGWLRPEDHGQTEVLARPARKTAAQALRRRGKKVRRAADGLEALDIEARHVLRKELKKLRYGVEFLAPAFPPERVKPFRKALKRLQDVFGSLNDAAAAEALFGGEDPPCPDDGRAQRAAGRLLGALERRAEDDWARARDGWTALAADRPFWK